MASDFPRLSLKVLPYSLAVCRLASEDALPDWAAKSRFLSITRTETELSIVCEAAGVPAGVRRESDWRALEVIGPLAFSLTGVLSSLLLPLAQAGMSIFAISTFDTDYVLVKNSRLDEAVDVLRSNGHTIIDV